MKRPKFTPEHAEIVINKRAHYTVTPISNILDWRAEQKRQQEIWDAGQSERFAKAKDGALRVLDGGQRSAAIVELERLETEYVKSREEAKKPAKITWDMIQAKKAEFERKNNSVRDNYASPNRILNPIQESPYRKDASYLYDDRLSAGFFERIKVSANRLYHRYRNRYFR